MFVCTFRRSSVIPGIPAELSRQKLRIVVIDLGRLGPFPAPQDRCSKHTSLAHATGAAFCESRHRSMKRGAPPPMVASAQPVLEGLLAQPVLWRWKGAQVSDRSRQCRVSGDSARRDSRYYTGPGESADKHRHL